MSEAGEQAGGWTMGRIIGLVIGLLGMAGFGVCSLCGMLIAGSMNGGAEIFFVFVLPGLGITFLFFLLVRAMIRRARKPPPQ